MSRRAWLGGLAFLVAIAILLLWTGSGERRRAPGPPARAKAERALTDRPSGFAPGIPVQLLVPSGEAPAPTVHGAFEGRVVSATTGEPISGAVLTFARPEETSSVTAGPAGRFRFDARVPGRWLLAAATAPGFLPFAPEWGQSPVLLEARTGEVVRGVTVALEPAEEYEGRVVDEQRAPVPGATVRVRGGGIGTTTLVALADTYRTDDRGSFRFTAPDDALVEVHAGGFAAARARIDPAVRVARRLTVTLARTNGPPLAIDGVVEDAAGTGVAGALVQTFPRSPPGAPPASTRSGEQGAFRLDDLAPGSWIVTASHGDLAPRAVEVPAGTSGVRLKLAAGGRIAGQVRDRASGAPVAAFTVVVQSATVRSVSVVDPSARYEVGGLLPGPAVVTVSAPGFAPSAEVRVVVPSPEDPAAIVDFDLSRGGTLTGVVLERGARRAISGARIAVEGATPSPGIPVRNETLSDASGSFALSGLAEGTVGLLASAAGHHARVVSVPPIREGETQGPITIDLAPAASGEEPRLEVAGIGAALQKRGAALVLTSVLPAGGAAEVGLVVGDEVIVIDGVPVAPMTLAEAIPRLRGPEGSTVTLVVVKGGDPQRNALVVIVPRRLVRS